MVRVLISLLILVTPASCINKTGKNSSAKEKISIKKIPFQGIKVNVHDAETSDELSARIVIEDEEGKVIDTYYKNLPGLFTNEDGGFERELSSGEYTIGFYHGLNYESQEIEIEIEENTGWALGVKLEPWVRLKDLGWYNGDGHAHLYTEEEANNEMLTMVRKICLAQGVDFICTNQGWAGYNDSTWKKGYDAFSDDRFHLYYGSEMPKYRTGHTWWIGQESTRGYFWKTMDENYEQKYYQSEKAEEWDFDNLKFPYIPDVDVVQRFRKAENAVAIMPHPTSWWWQNRGDITKYTTNIASYLSFGLLAGKIWDGLVVMGYDPEHYMYQQLWFNILNLGYRLPAIAELDGGLGKNDRFYYGSMRTYFHINGAFSIDKIADAVRKGKTFVTSGPIILADIDDKYSIGDVIPSDGKIHKLNIEARSSGEKDDFLSYVLIFRNGEVFKLWDLRERQVRKFKGSLDIKENEQSWFVIKAYGKNAWKDPAHLDVLTVSNSLLFDSITPYKSGPLDVAITSPFYFRQEDLKDKGAMESNIHLRLISENGDLIENAEIDILVNDEKIKTKHISGGELNFTMPVHGLLRIRHAGDTIIRGLYLDYAPHRDLIEDLASGTWMEDFDPETPFFAGEVPWEAFNYQETKDVLSNPEWEILFKKNERDHLWSDFEELFEQ